MAPGRDWTHQVGAAGRRPAGLTTGVGRLIGQRLHNITHPPLCPASDLFGTIAATGPASLADTRRAYQRSMQL